MVCMNSDWVLSTKVRDVRGIEGLDLLYSHFVSQSAITNRALDEALERV
jgi:hypothetical protein